MKRRVEQLLHGKFDESSLRLQVSTGKIHGTVRCGENYPGRDPIRLRASNGSRIRGLVSSDHRRILADREILDGDRPVIHYGVDTSGLHPGDRVEGSLIFSTNLGEKRIPVCVEVEPEQMQSSRGEIRSLKDFTSLEEEDKKEAYRIFSNPDAFLKLLDAEDPRQLSLYTAMAKAPLSYQNMEEYLIAAGQKDPIRCRLRQSECAFYGMMEFGQQSLEIQKSGKGHLELTVEVQGDFLQVPRIKLTEEDFIGSVCRLNFFIQEDKLHQGRHYGAIRIRSPYEELVCSVMATREDKIRDRSHQTERQDHLLFLKNYLRLCMHRIDYRDWVTETEEFLNRQKASGTRTPLALLYEVCFLNQQEETEKMKEILEEIHRNTFTEDDLEVIAGYLYYTHISGGDRDSSQVARELRSLYLRRPDSFWLFWLWISVEGTYRNSLSKLCVALEDLYEKGSRSPMLYLEAYRVILEKPNYLRRLTPFWIQVLRFADKYGILSENLGMRIANLAEYEKTFNRSLYQVLLAVYRQDQSDLIVTAICKYVMKSPDDPAKYFSWYEMAVDRGLNILHLYGHYMDSIDLSGVRMLPQSLLMYYDYKSEDLNPDRRAYLYACITAYQSQNPDRFSQYRMKMRNFTSRMLKKGKMNENYALLYQEFSMHPQTLEEAEDISSVLFTCRLYCEDPKIRSIAVRHGQLMEEEIVDCVDGVAYVKIYTDSAQIAFCDAEGHRYAATVDHNLRRMMDEKETVKKCLQLGVNNPGLLLYQCEGREVTSESRSFFESIARQKDFDPVFRNGIRRKLLDYYLEHSEEEEVRTRIRNMEYQDYAAIDTAAVLHLLIGQGLCFEAFTIVEEFGCEGLDPTDLRKLTANLISRSIVNGAGLTVLAYQCLEEDSYDSVILNYLMENTNGPADRLLKIWNACRILPVETAALEERLLRLLMLCWDFRPQGELVYQSLMRSRENSDVCRAYRTFAAFGEVCRGARYSHALEGEIGKALEQGKEMDPVCGIFYLRRLSEKKELLPSERLLAKRLLKECRDRQLSFAFFRDLPLDLRELYQLEDKCFVEYRGDEGCRVTLYYALYQGFPENGERNWRSEPLKEVYHGYYSRTFTLFCGETIRYYFRVEKDRDCIETETVELSVEGRDEPGTSRFAMLNRILYLHRNGEQAAAGTLLEEYLQQERYVKEMFTIEKES